MTDEKIVDLYWNRDESAIDETDKKYKSYLTKIALNILSDIEDSKECVNDTYLAAWKSIPPHRPTVLQTFLSKITRRISIDVYRKRNRDKRKGSEYSLSLSEISHVVSNEPLPDDLLSEKLLSEKINEFLKNLKPTERTAFIGRYYFFDSVKDIARYCGMTQANTKTVLYRTRLALKKYLEKEGFDL